MVTIKELASSVGFRGSKHHRVAEPQVITNLPVIDNSLPNQSNVRTSIDCYVTGQYVAGPGKTIEVFQRYTIFVSYAAGTQMQTMKQVRERVANDFADRYGTSFNISNVYVPALPVPKPEIPGIAKGEVAPLEMYLGSAMFRGLTKYERMRYEIGTQRAIAKTNIESIRERYGYGKER